MVLAGRGRTRCGHQNQRPSSAAIDGVMNDRTISVSNSRPIAIVVPCHRVLGASGALTGYAGGLARKQALLELEGVLTAGSQSALF